MTFFLVETAEDFWQYAEEVLGQIDEDFLSNKIDKETALVRLNELESELKTAVKLENPVYQEQFLYRGIAAWIENMRLEIQNES